MDRAKKHTGDKLTEDEQRERNEEEARKAAEEIEPNPPRTKTGPFAAPKFGSAGSGGAELEPGPPKP